MRLQEGEVKYIEGKEAININHSKGRGGEEGKGRNN